VGDEFNEFAGTFEYFAGTFLSVLIKMIITFDIVTENYLKARRNIWGE